ncbi:TlpA family protein disulfide reductase [Paraburkholderia gardini]|uniref:Thiol-disulfide oxidoreductase ResA n=1 Tax=Paraburkholderia gardini TaxID=2823469 RepID=A0ABM8TZ98_9BURK|nr:TlpA disulfide reductase family protein [Paraburkholderia gardini]CAG4889911.1 Thiol-disulfide oxidoreductase ResA [Paraburkholderia gardini]CAG4891950.1 Thiol-disulfide oxidoreductase ResA [Paraburkholderia gardini]
MKRILAALAVAVVAAGGGAAAGYWFLNGNATQAAQSAQSAQPGATAATRPQDAVNALWAQSVTNADGKPQSLSMFKGHPVVVNFWASWCGPCVEEMPALSQLHRDYSKKGIQFIGLGVDSEKNVKTFLQKVKVDYPVFVTGFGGADLAREFGNNAGGLPYTVVIDAKGNVLSTKLGEVQPAELKRTLDAL